MPKKKDRSAEIILKAFGNRVAMYRQKSGMTARELGQTIGVCQSAITFIEIGRSGTSIENILKLCSALNVTPTQLLPPLPENMSISKNQSLLEGGITRKTRIAKLQLETIDDYGDDEILPW